MLILAGRQLGPRDSFAGFGGITYIVQSTFVRRQQFLVEQQSAFYCIPAVMTAFHTSLPPAGTVYLTLFNF
jgi:hypothetical protein